MRENRIVVEPFHFLNYLKFECIKEINDHGVLKIRGLVADCDVDLYERLVVNELWVCVKIMDENENIRIFFRGLLTWWETEKNYGGNILSIELHTGSFLLDIEPHIRSFQQNTMLFADVIEQCLEKTDSKFIIHDKKDIRINQFLFQYKETNWEFLLRLAEDAGTVLIPDYTMKGKNFYFGYFQSSKEVEINSNEYTIIKNFGECQETYVVCLREVYDLGEIVRFRNRKLIISKIFTYLNGSELYHKYYLMSAESRKSTIKMNKKIRGVSLLAQVVQVQNTCVQIKIQSDENKEKSGYKWFDYATIYSTPDGTGWYCMPEVGDAVRIVFPDEDENNAYVMSSVHLEVENVRNNPEHKSWRNRQNKEILFTPDSLVIRNNKGLVVELSDQDGIVISSDKNITLNADKNINLTSQNSGITVNANSLLSLIQGCARIDMNDTINIAGGKIFMN